MRLQQIKEFLERPFRMLDGQGKRWPRRRFVPHVNRPFLLATSLDVELFTIEPDTQTSKCKRAERQSKIAQGDIIETRN